MPNLSASKKFGTSLHDLGRPAQALTVLCLTLFGLLLLVAHITLKGRTSGAHRAVLKPYLVTEADTSQPGPASELKRFQKVPSTVTQRLAPSLHEARPDATQQALTSGSIWPKIYIYDLPEYPFKTSDRSEDNADEIFRLTSNYAAEV